MENFDDQEFIMNTRKWPGDTLCLKKRPREGEKVGIMGYADYGVITTNRLPINIWRDDGSLAARFETLDALLEAGWIVDTEEKYNETHRPTWLWPKA